MAELEAAAAQAAGNGARVSDAELAELRSQLQRKTETEESLRRQNETLQRERNDAHRRITTEVDQRYVAEEQAIDNGLAAAISDADRLEDVIADLNEKGEFREATKRTRELASAQTRIDGFNWRKQQLQSARERAQAQAAHAAQDPLAKYGQPGSPTRRWIDAHPQFITDDLYNHNVVGAHKKALRQGMSEGTPAYFEFIEREIGERKAEEPAVRREAPKTEATGGEVTSEESPLSEASEAEVADAKDPEVEIEEPEQEDSGEVEVDEQAIRQAQEQAAKQATRRAEPTKKPAKTATAAPPSRGSTASTAREPERGRVKLSRDEAEQAISAYPPGTYMIDGEEVSVKNQMDAFRVYHAAREKLRAEGKIGSGVVR